MPFEKTEKFEIMLALGDSVERVVIVREKQNHKALYILMPKFDTQVIKIKKSTHSINNSI